MKLTRRTLTLGMAATPVALSSTARATDYFSLDEVNHQLFPEATVFEDASFSLSKDQKKTVSKKARVRVRSAKMTLFNAIDADKLLGFVVIDEVYGKHEFITYAIALTPDYAVNQIEIMRYLETYGDEIRNPAWRAQFNGKRAGDVLAVKKDIANISGATLSCVHITEGVKRVLTTMELAHES